MGDISAVFAEKKHTLLIAYLTLGYPSLEVSLQAVRLLEESGADIIELGIPFSDPLVDGATIQQASYQALQNGITPPKCLEALHSIREQVKIPLLFMSYYNPIYQYGPEKFCADSSGIGINGFIIPDLPPEESVLLEQAAKGHDLDMVYLVAPGTPQKRLEEIERRSSGFIYLVSVEGVTGTRQGLPGHLEEFVARVRKATSKPLCLGFGISTPYQVNQVAKDVDGVIVGSGIVELMGRNDWQRELSQYVRDLKSACNGGSAYAAG